MAHTMDSQYSSEYLRSTATHEMLTGTKQWLVKILATDTLNRESRTVGHINLVPPKPGLLCALSIAILLC